MNGLSDAGDGDTIFSSLPRLPLRKPRQFSLKFEPIATFDFDGVRAHNSILAVSTARRTGVQKAVLI